MIISIRSPVGDAVDHARAGCADVTPSGAGSHARTSEESGR
jgi:hypothetical protein